MEKRSDLTFQGDAEIDISIIIPTLNAGAAFVDTLSVLANQKLHLAFEVVVIDSGSSDETLELAKNAGARIMLVDSDAFHHAHTRNLAAATCKGRYLVFLVQDAIPANEQWLHSLIKALDESPGVVGAYSAQLPHADASPLSQRLTMAYQDSLSDRDLQCLESGVAFSELDMADRLRLCRFDNVSSIMLRSVWEKHPLPDVPYAEDLAWARKVLLDGYALRRVRDSIVYHSHERPLSYVMRREYVQARTVGDILGDRPISLERDEIIRLLQFDSSTRRADNIAKAMAEGLLDGARAPRAIVPYVEKLFSAGVLERLLGPDSAVPQDEQEWLIGEAVEDWTWGQVRSRLSSGGSLLLDAVVKAASANSFGAAVKALFSEQWFLEPASYRDMAMLPGVLVRRRSKAGSIGVALVAGEQLGRIPRALKRAVLRRIVWHWADKYSVTISSLLADIRGRAECLVVYEAWRMACWLWRGMDARDRQTALQVVRHSLVATSGHLLGEAARQGGDSHVRSVLDAQLAKGV